MIRERFKPRILSRLLIMLFLSGGFLWLMNSAKLLNWTLFRDAFSGGGALLFLIATILIIMPLLGAAKHYFILRALYPYLRFFDVLLSGVIGQAIGQWVPGSMAVTEIVRFGLVARLGAGQNARGESTIQPLTKGEIGLSILLDRLIGFAMMLIVSGAVALMLLAQKDTVVRSPIILLGPAVISLAAGGGLLMMLFLPRTLPYLRLSRHIGKKAAQYSQRISANVKTNKLRGKSWLRVFSLMEMIEAVTSRRGGLTVPLLISLVLTALNPITFYLSARAIGRSLPLSAILVAVPFTVFSLFLPLGIAGFGGQQLMVAGVFSMFRVSPEVVVASSLVLNTIALATYTLCGGIGAVFAIERMSTARIKRLDRL